MTYKYELVLVTQKMLIKVKSFILSLHLILYIKLDI